MEGPRSVISKRLLADIARDGGGNVEKAATGDPSPKSTNRRPVARAKRASAAPKRRKRAT